MKTQRFPTGIFCLALFLAAAAGAVAAPAFKVSYGSVTATATPLVDGGKVTLGTTNTTATQVVFLITNTGTEDLTGVTVTPAAPNDYILSSVLSSAPFAPGVEGRFTATLRPGLNASHKQVIQITASGLTANPFDIELNAPEISLEQGGDVLFSDQEVAFGRLGAASPGTLTFTVRNVGSATLSKLQLGYYNNPGYNYGDYSSAGLNIHERSLAPNGTLTFSLSLKPGKTSNHDSKWYVPSNDADEVPFKIHLVAPEITVESPLGTNLIDGSAVLDFGTMTGGPTPNITTISVRNTGSAPLNGLSTVLSGPGAADYTVVSLPVTSLPPTVSAQFTVSFDPAATQGSHQASLEILSTDADETRFNIALKAPEIAVETSGRDLTNNGDFGFDTEFGTSRTAVFTVRNKGSSTLTNLGAFLGGPAAAEYTVFGPKATTLAPNATTTFNVKFTPAGPGPRVAYVQLTSNDFSEFPFNIIFREPRIQVEAPPGTVLVNGKSTIDFGALPGGPSNPVTVTIRNVGGATLDNLSKVLGGVDAGDFTAGSLGATSLAPDATTTFTLTLDPLSQKTHAATLDILSNDDAQSPFRVAVKAPEIVVERPAGTSLVSGISTVDFGTVSTVNSSTFTLTVKNKGSSPLTGLVASVASGNAADFTVAGPPVSTLAPGGKTTFTVKFSPSTPGPRATVLQIANNDVDEGPFLLPVAGFGLMITQHPEPQLVRVGESASFQVSAITSTPPVFTWLKNGVPIPGSASHAAIYTIPVVALSDAAAYSCLVVDGTVTISSGKARLGVVGSAETSLTVNEDTPIVLKLQEAIPPGTPPTHEWQKGGPVGNGGSAPGQVVSGATTPVLNITKAAEGNGGSYTCVVGMDGLIKESGPFSVSVRLKPVINPDSAGPFNWLVSGTVTDQITAANGPTSFTFKGLPAGVTGSTTTGQLSGKPNTATTGSMSFTVFATNQAGAGPVRTVGYTTAALPAAVAGTFNGLIDRSTALSSSVAGGFTKGHGGAINNLVITSTGSFTGTVALEDKNHALPATGRLNAIANGNPSASVLVLRGTASDAIPDLTLTFEIDRNTGELTGGLSDGVAALPVPVKAWHKPWLVSSNPDLNHPATAAGNYTAALQLEPSLAGTASPNEANLVYPQGTGSLSIKVEPDGDVTGGGVLADGVSVTLNTTLGPDGEIPLHFMLYTPTVAATAGSLHGWSKITATNWDSVSPLNWLKLAQLPASTTRSYKEGFPLHNLTLTGGEYAAPAANTVVLGFSGPPANARLVFNEGGIKNSALGVAGFLEQVFAISTANVVTMPSGGANPGVVTLSTFKAATGAIGGTFALSDNDPRDTTEPFVKVPRSVPWSGVMVPRLGRGVGQFQLPKLPTSSPATTPTTSPTLSGKVELLSNQ